MPHSRDAPPSRASTSGQTCEHSTPRDAPELIHPDKDQNPIKHRGTTTPSQPFTEPQCRTSSLLRDTPSQHHLNTTPPSCGVVEVIGLEPTTPCLQSRCSPS